MILPPAFKQNVTSGCRCTLKWPEGIEMFSTTSSKTIDELRRLFTMYGLPEQLVTENSLQFVSQEFSSFMKVNGIKHYINVSLPSSI